MQTPLISIIIPTFNSAATLAVALESIVHQTLKNWELVIMDGVSADSTIEIAKKYQDKFPKNIRINSERDKGIYDAMNKGIDLVNGNWLYFMGSDDYLYDLKVLENIFKSDYVQAYDIIYGNVFSTRFNGIYDGEFTHSKLINKNICHQAIFFNKSVFKKIGKFNLKYQAHADWEHNIRWFFSSKIKHMYNNLIIANYADGGFSSHGDAIFEKDKLSLLFFKGFKVFSYSELISICTNIILLHKKDNIKLKLLFYSLVRFLLRQLRKIKNQLKF